MQLKNIKHTKKIFSSSFSTYTQDIIIIPLVILLYNIVQIVSFTT